MSLDIFPEESPVFFLSFQLTRHFWVEEEVSQFFSPPLFQRLNETNVETAQEGKYIKGEKHQRGERN